MAFCKNPVRILAFSWVFVLFVMVSVTFGQSCCLSTLSDTLVSSLLKAGFYDVRVDTGASCTYLSLSGYVSGTTPLIPMTLIYNAKGSDLELTVQWTVNGQTTVSKDTVNNWCNAPTAPDQPVLLYPSSGAAHIPTIPILGWNTSARAETYHLQVSSVFNFASVVYDQAELTSTSKMISGLANNMTYYWRVNAANAGGTSPWSTIWNFITIVAPATVPILVSPVNGSLDVPLEPVLTWNKVAVADSYTVQLSKSSSFSSFIVSQGGLTMTEYAVSSLINNTQYYWRVNATNYAGTSEWSAIDSFTTVVSVNVIKLPKERMAVSLRTCAAQNMLRYALPVCCHVSINLYDIQGRLLQSLVDQVQEAGYYSLPISVGARGSYLLVCKAGNYQSRKQVLIVQ